MSDAYAAPGEKTLLGHPVGLWVLFLTEMWERYSYYGMRALLFLYMVGSTQRPGLGFDEARAGTVYGAYTFSVWGLGIFGGLVADWWLGHYRSVFVGGCIIALGHFSMAVPGLPFFYSGLVLIAVGTGLLKPNVSSMVGGLYRKDDKRRDAGFSLFYTGINLGAFFAPFVTGWLGQKINWHVGFAAAGVGMVFGLIIYVSGKRYLTPVQPAEQPLEPHKPSNPETPAPGLTHGDWVKLGVLGILWCFCVVFWAGYEQAGTSLNLFADRATRLTLFGFNYPSSWFQSIAPLCVWVFAGLFAILWQTLGKHEPSSPVKFTMGLVFLSLSYLLIVNGARIHEQQHILVSGLWLVGVYLLQTFGEICLYPTGMSMVTKLSPQRYVGVVMGFWFLSIAIGNMVAGQVAGLLKDRTFSSVFWIAFVTSGVAAVLLAIIVRPINRQLART